MCDYSLLGIPNRLAAEGEQLVVHKFRTGSMGLASPADIPSAKAVSTKAQPTFWQYFVAFFKPEPVYKGAPAVCIPPGAQLVVRDIPSVIQRQCRVSAKEAVVFTQLTADVNSYRDAIRFGNSYELRLQDLHEGMRVEVVSLAGVTDAAPVVEGHLALR